LAKMTLLAAGLLLSSAVALMAAAPAQAVTDCKSAWGNSAACSKSAKLNIVPAPTPKPAPGAKPHGAAKPSAPSKPPVTAAAKPHAAPRIAGRPVPTPHRQALNKRPLPHRAPRSVVPRHAYAQNGHAHHRRNRQEWEIYGNRQTASRDDYRPPSGPVYESGPGYAAGGPAPSFGCDQDCQYRDWLARYSAWYDRYGRTYGATQNAPANRSYGPAGPAAAYYGRPDQSERDRLDPWHGYNPHVGPANGY
jgi:hypothetical protein